VVGIPDYRCHCADDGIVNKLSASPVFAAKYVGSISVVHNPTACTQAPSVQHLELREVQAEVTTSSEPPVSRSEVQTVSKPRRQSGSPTGSKGGLQSTKSRGSSRGGPNSVGLLQKSEAKARKLPCEVLTQAVGVPTTQEKLLRRNLGLELVRKGSKRRLPTWRKR
jgi:hypothetical protein